MHPPLANLITLVARDFTTLGDFYRRLDWPQVMDSDDFAAFELRGVVCAVFPVARLARDGRRERDPGTGGIRFSIGITVETVASDTAVLSGHENARGPAVTGKRPARPAGQGWTA